MLSLELVVLGSAGSYLDPADGIACSGFLLRSKSSSLLLDCGFGVLANAYKHIDIGGVEAVFLSHIHPDHCADIFNLNGYLRQNPQRKPINVMCHQKMRSHLDAYVERWSPSIEWLNVDGRSQYRIGDMICRFQRTRHGPPTYACEVRCGNLSVIYTSDTGPGWDIRRFRGNADLVICDAGYVDPQDGPPVHMTARQAGQLACKMGARRLLLTHIRPGADTERMKKEAREYFAAELYIAVPHLRLNIE